MQNALLIFYSKEVAILWKIEYVVKSLMFKNDFNVAQSSVFDPHYKID